MQTTRNPTSNPDIAVDLTWIDTLKGIAIVGVFLDNWAAYAEFSRTPAPAYALANVVALGVGPFVQIFFILSGFGLTLAYFKVRANWGWRRWVWRRTTKVVVPYEIAVLFSFLLGGVGATLYHSVTVRFSWASLLANLTLTRNFYAPSWDWNRPFWFMPIIVGLYLSFPVLIKILEKWGRWALLLVSALVTYGTITVALLLDAPRSHQADLFTFALIQFALGMVLAQVRVTQPQQLRRLLGLPAFSSGVALFAFSWGLRTFFPATKAYNDLFSAVGILLILLNLSWTGRSKIPALDPALQALSRQSFLMYLIHYPIMAFLVGPLLAMPINGLLGIILGGVFIAATFVLCYGVSQPLDRLTSWLYLKYPTH